MAAELLELRSLIVPLKELLPLPASIVKTVAEGAAALPSTIVEVPAPPLLIEAIDGIALVKVTWAVEAGFMVTGPLPRALSLAAVSVPPRMSVPLL